MPHFSYCCSSLQHSNRFRIYVKRNSLSAPVTSTTLSHLKPSLSQDKTKAKTETRDFYDRLLQAPEEFEEVREAVARLRVEALDTEELAAAVLADWRKGGV